MKCCKNCPKRKIGCHANCPDYAEEKEEWEKKKKWEKEHRAPKITQFDFDRIVYDNVKRRKK